MSATTERRSLSIRRSSERGHAHHGWLEARHTFSFADYIDPAHHRFRALRVMNEDRVAPGQGFGLHPHRDMEIVTLVLEGALEHRDSLGSSEVLRPGEIQRMTAGTGILHSEMNPSATEAVHLYQIWIMPERRGLTPGYEQRTLPTLQPGAGWQLVAAPEGQGGVVSIHQDARLARALLSPGDTLEHVVAPGRAAWIQVVRGEVAVDGHNLSEGDGASTEDAGTLSLTGVSDAEILLFDLA